MISRGAFAVETAATQWSRADQCHAELTCCSQGFSGLVCVLVGCAMAAAGQLLIDQQDLDAAPCPHPVIDDLFRSSRRHSCPGRCGAAPFECLIISQP